MLLPAYINFALDFLANFNTFNVGEILGLRLITYHNSFCYNRFVKNIRLSIEDNQFEIYKNNFLKNYNLVLKD